MAGNPSRLTAAQRKILESDEARELVERHVRQFMARWRGVEAGEIRSLANEAAVAAVLRFNSERCPRFAAFAAKRVHGHILRTLAREKARTSLAATFSDADNLNSLAAGRRTGVLDVLNQSHIQGRALAADWAQQRVTSLTLKALWTQDAEEQLGQRQEYRRVMSALRDSIARLHEKQRRFLALYYRERKTHAEIARHFARSERTVERLHLASLVALRKQLISRGVVSPPDR